MYNNVVDEIKNKCNIVDVIGHVVTLKKAGSNYKGLCPFHNEKTPSFVVSEQKQIFTCFGCGAGGDVIGFVMRYYNLDFQQAVERLAGEYGIKINNGFGRNEKHEELYEINRDAAMFFVNALRKPGNPGYKYIRQRGIDDKTLTKFGIGYADDSWDSLHDYLNSKGYDDKKLLSIGLISESKGKCYDKFRNRVMFPIINTRGKVIGFGGRALGDAQPKYLNSKESDIFLKKNNLYGLNLARKDISKEDKAILVEGYMDVVSLYQEGIRNVSASLGTSLTEDQARLLKRYTDKVILSYDSDNAGVKAALRGIDILTKEEINVKVLHVEGGKDPDEYIKKKGKQSFLELVDRALPYIDYKIENIKSKIDLSDTEGRMEFMKKFKELLKTLPLTTADIYIKKIAREMNFSEGAIRMELYGEKDTALYRNDGTKNAQDKTKKNENAGNDATQLEKTLIKLAVTDNECFENLIPYAYIIKNESALSIWKCICSAKDEGEDIRIEELKKDLEKNEQILLENIIESVPVSDPDKMFIQCVARIELKELRKREKELELMLSVTDENEDAAKIEELMREQNEIQNEIQKVKNEYGGLQ